jgi:hypothetical protein
MPRHAANTLRAALLGAVCAATMAGHHRPRVSKPPTSPPPSPLRNT